MAVDLLLEIRNFLTHKIKVHAVIFKKKKKTPEIREESMFNNRHRVFVNCLSQLISK